MTLDSTGTLALAAAILLAGRFLNAGIAPLARYNIPQPISGGLAFALLAAALHAWGGLVVETSATLRAPLLLAFLSGAVIMNSLILELPTEKDGRFWPFLTGGLLYGLVLLPLG